MMSGFTYCVIPHRKKPWTSPHRYSSHASSNDGAFETPAAVSAVEVVPQQVALVGGPHIGLERRRDVVPHVDAPRPVLRHLPVEQTGSTVAVEERVADVRVAVRDRPTGARQPATRGCSYASMRACASRVPSGTPAPFGPSKLALISLIPRTCRIQAKRGVSHDDSARRASSHAYAWRTRELLERLGGPVDGAGIERVAEHRARLDRVLGDHDAVLGARVDVGPHAVERAHAGGVGEVTVEARLGHARLRASSADLAEVPLGTERGRQAVGQVALDLEAGVRRHALDDRAPGHRLDPHPREPRRRARPSARPG